MKTTIAGLNLGSDEFSQGVKSSLAQVEDLLKKSFRIKVDDMYDMKLISPAKAEKLLKKAEKIVRQNKNR